MSLHSPPFPKTQQNVCRTGRLHITVRRNSFLGPETLEFSLHYLSVTCHFQYLDIILRFPIQTPKWYAYLALRQRLKCLLDLLVEARQEPESNSDPVTGNIFNQILHLRVVHLLTIFAIIYEGVEVTLGGWSVTFIIDKRGGGSEAGYISSGFFGGLTLGRVGLIWLNKKVGGVSSRRTIS